MSRPGTNMTTNPNAVLTLSANCIFTNTALTDDGDVWWEGLTETRPATASTGGATTGPRSPDPAAHPNSRFTAPASQDPAIASEWQDPAGVPISAILFGGRRGIGRSPCLRGLRLGSMGSSSARSCPRRPPRPPRAPSASCGGTRSRCCPFCGYNMADYWAHWLSFRDPMDEDKLPRIFYVNWFRKDADGRFLWPGFGENSRVLEWIFERCAGRGEAVQTPIGYLPAPGAIDIDGLDLSEDDMKDFSMSTRTNGAASCPRSSSTSPSSPTACRRP